MVVSGAPRLNHGRRLTYPIPGQLFTGRYEIQAVVGAGGFSRVYLAVQTELDRPVAIKVLKPHEKTSDEEAADQFDHVISRFRQEAKLISRLKDQNTVVIYDYGSTDDGLLYMVMEYVDGLTLRQLTKGQPLEAERVVYILRQVLSSLEEAHTLGVLHRDVKPANIMVYEHAGRRDQVKLLDFGIAKVLEKESRPVTKMDLTGDGMLVGTPRYMSPEQIRGEELTPASDLYSLGLVVYELLVGTKAVNSDSSISIISRHLDPEPIAVPPDLEIPDRLRQIVDRMLSKSPTLRYETCKALLEDLRDWDRYLDDSMDDTVKVVSRSFEKMNEVEQSLGNVEAVPDDPSEELVVDPGIQSAKLGAVIIMVLLLVGGGWWASSSFSDSPEEREREASSSSFERKDAPSIVKGSNDDGAKVQATHDGVLEAAVHVSDALDGARSIAPDETAGKKTNAKDEAAGTTSTRSKQRQVTRKRRGAVFRTAKENKSSNKSAKQTQNAKATSSKKDADEGSGDDGLGIFAIE